MDFQKLTRNVMKLAANIASEEEHRPILTMTQGDDAATIAIAGAPPAETLPKLLNIINPQGYILVVEARIKGMHQEDLSIPRKPGEIANDPSLPESLFVFAVEKGISSHTYMAEIKPGRHIQPWREINTFRGALLVETW